MFSTNAITSQFPTRSAREEEGENARRICFGVISTDGKLHPYNIALLFFSERQYTVPDEPGLFDGHVWPMYLKHRKLMEDSGLNIRKFL